MIEDDKGEKQECLMNNMKAIDKVYQLLKGSGLSIERLLQERSSKVKEEIQNLKIELIVEERDKSPIDTIEQDKTLQEIEAIYNITTREG